MTDHFISLNFSLSPGSRLYAIGDVHGCLTALQKLIRKICAHDEAQPPIAGHEITDRKLVFLGDYIDRGPHSREVIDYLLSDLPPQFEAIFLRGNHESLLLDSLSDRPRYFENWLLNGGYETLASYGVERSAIDADFQDMNLAGTAQSHAGQNFYELPVLRSAFIHALPEAHRQFFLNTKICHLDGGFLFVHAGIRPGIALDQQVEEDLLWIRSPFLNYEGTSDFYVVHGHSPVTSPALRQNRAGIDTGAVFGHALTALFVEGDKIAPLQVGTHAIC